MDAADLAPASMLSGWIEEHFSLEKLVRTLAAFVGGIVNFFVGLVASI